MNRKPQLIIEWFRQLRDPEMREEFIAQHLAYVKTTGMPPTNRGYWEVESLPAALMRGFGWGSCARYPCGMIHHSWAYSMRAAEEALRSYEPLRLTAQQIQKLKADALSGTEITIL